MNEDAKLSVVVSRGKRPRIQGVPRGLVSNARGREVVGVFGSGWVRVREATTEGEEAKAERQK